MNAASGERLSWLKLSAIAAVAIGFGTVIWLDVPASDIRVEINTRYVQLDYQGGELVSSVAKSLTLYDIEAQSDGDRAGLTDVTLAATDPATGITLTSVNFGQEPVRLTVQVQATDAYDFAWQPQAAPLAVIAPAGATVATRGTQAVALEAEALQMYTPSDETSRLAITSPTNRGDVLRTDALLAASFAPVVARDNGVVFSDIVAGTLVWSELENKQMDIPRGETVVFDFVDSASLSMTLQPDAIKVVIAGAVRDVRFGNNDKQWSAMPSLFEYLGHQAWAKAVAAFFAVFLVPVFIERVYAR